MHNRDRRNARAFVPVSRRRRTPGGVRTETVSCVDRFKFDWHVVYEYADDVARSFLRYDLHVISLYDIRPATNSIPIHQLGATAIAPLTRWASLDQLVLPDRRRVQTAVAEEQEGVR